jgi:hypothetical protein
LDETLSPSAVQAAATPPGPPHLADPRALQILSTEHWSLLTARSLVYNEFFARGSMFLTLLSASLVALGFVYQGAGGGPDFPLMVVAVLALDLFVGLATLGRLLSASSEEMHALQAMTRVRHAYLEMVPALAPYFSTSSHDDIGSTLEVYGATPANEAPPLLNLAHGLTTMPGMVAVIDATLAGGLAAGAAVMLGADSRLALIAGIVVGLASIVGLMALGVRTFSRQSRFLESRFPAPRGAPAAAADPPTID